MSAVLQLSRRSISLGLILSLFSGGFVAAMLGWSAFTLTLTDLSTVLFSAPESIAQQLLVSLRLPRVLVAMLVGASLAVAGALMQAITRNPLASPSLFGINAGAACMLIVVSSGWLPFLNGLPLLLSTAIGALISALLVLALGGALQGRLHPVRVLLAGIAVTAALTALTRTLLILDEEAQAVVDWLTGSLADIGWDHWQHLWPFAGAALLLSLLLSQGLNLLALGDEVAIGLGVNPLRTRLAAGGLVIVLAASAVAVAGPVAFVGLLVPHVMRALVGRDHRVLIPATALGGAALMLWADALSRALAFPAETPVGVVTALIGAPCFLYLSCTQGGTR